MRVHRIKRGSLGGLVVGLAVVTAVLFAAAPVGAGKGKTTVCHGTGNGSFHAIEVSESAVPAHLEHGDGLVGDAVPGQPGSVFGESCQLVPGGGNTPPFAYDDVTYDINGIEPPSAPNSGSLSATDADGDVLTYEIVSTETDLYFVSFDSATGEWRAECFTGTSNYSSGSSTFWWATFTWRAYDGQAYSNVATQAVLCFL